IESLLFLKVKLPDLEMPVATQGMLYPGTSGITDQDLRTAREIILNKISSPEQVLEILLSSEEWRNRIIAANKADFEAIDSDFGSRMETACTSDSTQNVTAVVKDLEEQRNQATLSLVRVFTQAWLEQECAALLKQA
ncbi:MAG TPA: NEL-type E3 ubiquitin ligase domain-containing protein, partial [Candidatus Paceibacterota bacterium]|nr:NEL-type E3 ubiquitin ligase domain-containing protein [Candidatus Paceibacterota bacterium]